MKKKDLDACYKKKRALPLLDGVNDLLLLISICQFQRLLHWSSDLPHLSVKVDLPFLLINMKIATTTTKNVGEERHLIKETPLLVKFSL